jgi:SNF2 family DNA or RNA helicase
MKIPAKGEKEKWSNFFFQKKQEEYAKNGKKGPTCWAELTSSEKDELKEYIKANARMVNIIKDATNLEELKLKISDIYLRRTKEDISEGLPNKTVHEIFYDFDMQQEFEYARLWEEYEAAQLELDPTKEINKDLLEGAVYRKYCSNQMIPNTIKLADEFIKQGEKVIIATCYDEELYKLRDYYGDKCVIFNGKLNPKQKDAAKEAFLTNPEKMVFIGQLFAAGVGLNLVVSNKLIFNDLDYVPGNNRQMEDRIYRMGQKRDVDIYYQIFNGTQYEKMWNTVLRKELAINQIIKKENEK